MYLKPFMQYSFSLLEKSSIWSFGLLKRICNPFIWYLSLWFDCVFTKGNYGSVITLEQNLWFFYFPQKGQQNQEFFALLYSIMRAMGKGTQISLKTGRSWIIWTLLGHVAYLDKIFFFLFFSSFIQQLRHSTTALVF